MYFPDEVNKIKCLNIGGFSGQVRLLKKSLCCERNKSFSEILGQSSNKTRKWKVKNISEVLSTRKNDLKTEVFQNEVPKKFGRCSIYQV